MFFWDKDYAFMFSIPIFSDLGGLRFSELCVNSYRAHPIGYIKEDIGIRFSFR